ncbi:formimidoylglutamase [Adhaeribacter aquaticus]|uniref:formimidoylglutamase n=1 Tax=Adhaeribacter aquaticus TaxID=299567 RepID=UPI0003F8EE6F|nr:formimidoylglutamase [Adhaeribacter aquaticus]
MNLSIFFEPLRDFIDNYSHDVKSVGSSLSIFTQKFPEWRSADIALIGMNEYRGANQNTPTLHPANEVRKKLYRLKKGTGTYKVVDLGNLLPGITLEDTYLRLKEIVENLVSSNTLPIIIGGSHDLDYGQFLGYENLEKVINLVTVDSSIDMTEGADTPQHKKHLHRILMHEPNYLFSLSQLGHQSYLVEPEVTATLEKLHFETIRVGEIHKNVQLAEPVIRQADMLSFDVKAINGQAAPNITESNPFGLTGEEACQLCWYAGLNDHLTSFGIYEYNPEQDLHGTTAMTISVMIWYFLEGFSNRKNEIDFTGKKFVKYAIAFHDNPNKMAFYKSKVSDKWWMEVEGLGKEKLRKIVPCSYDDYIQASNGEVPNRWILTQGRMA